MVALDAIDHALLDHLRRDCRAPNAELAKKLGLSASSCWRRIRALEENGVISRYSAVIDARAIGLQFQAVVHVHLTRHDADQLTEFISAVQAHAAVKDCYATTGQSDYHLFVQCRDLEAYNDFLEGFLFRLPAVASAQTNVILKTIKSRD